MPAGDHERSHRVKRRIIEFILFGIDEHTVHVGEKMVDPDQRLSIGGNKPLGEIQPDQQCGDKPGGVRHGDRIDLIERDAGSRHRLIADLFNRGQMFARRQFRHDAAVDSVFRHLR